MPENVICPSCGRSNPAGAPSCVQCNFPFDLELAAGRGGTAPGSAPPRGERPTSAPEVIVRRPLRRPVRRPPAMSNQQLTLWLLFAAIGAAAVIYAAVQANLQRQTVPVEGSSENQQKQADEFRAALEKDSSSVDAHIGLANVLYDTANWSDAIVHYRSALRRDSSRVGALVDLGVCYYNLGDPIEAQRHFQLALRRQPNQPVALFNLGIVSEGQKDYTSAMSYFHRTLEAGAPDEIKTAVIAAMQRVQQKSGRTPQPLSPGTAPGGETQAPRP
jgi:cytochrome c-type biogenesis protein CcmH/NrfG